MPKTNTAGHALIPVFMDPKIIDIATGYTSPSFEWLEQQVMIRLGWKSITPKRRDSREYAVELYYIGRESIKPPKEPTLMELIPRVVNKGVKAVFRKKEKKL